MTNRLAVQILALGTLITAFSAPAHAQTWSVEAGDRVRVHPRNGASLQGELATVASEAFEIRIDDGGTRVVPIDAIARVDRSLGVRADPIGGAGRGFVVGGTIGAVLGLIAGATDDPNGWFEVSPLEGAAGLGLMGGATGGVLGLVFGAIPKERWAEVEPSNAVEHVRAALASATIRPIVGPSWGASVSLPLDH